MALMKQQSLLTLILGFGGVLCVLGFFLVFPLLLHLWYLNVLQIRITVLEGGRDENYVVSTASKHTPEQR